MRSPRYACVKDGIVHHERVCAAEEVGKEQPGAEEMRGGGLDCYTRQVAAGHNVDGTVAPWAPSAVGAGLSGRKPADGEYACATRQHSQPHNHSQ